ncbi:hypothetical protein HFN_1006 [Helicobacter fennelliae MRY12-0050]|uniref:Uncharacterized protein n=1 Tax=Helicobacter fennelliae MRY12-0050 TaxID=1325130 RepID=T1D3H0_9HELI|nr:hypothetical protein HFN_1006 [Helicobacter fennelliae MRY12-0050]
MSRYFSCVAKITQDKPNEAICKKKQKERIWILDSKIYTHNY